MENPGVALPENFLATYVQCVQEFVAEIPLTLDHHSGKNGVALRLGDILPPRVPLALEAERRIIHGEINVFGEAVYGVEDFRQRCPALEKAPPRQDID